VRFLADKFCHHVAADGIGEEVSPARQKIATNHGSTSTSVHIRPQTGRSRHSQDALRSRIASVTIVSPTNIRISGP